MDNEFFIDEGHCMDREDLIQYVKWKIKDLFCKGYCRTDILNFYENIEWKRIVKLLIKQIG